MDGKEAAEWLTGLGTLVLAAVAVFQDSIRAFFYRPKFSVSIKTEPPDCMGVPERFIKPAVSGNLITARMPTIVEVPAIYLRLPVKNVGNATALNAEVYANELNRKRADGSWELISGFSPMNLAWQISVSA
jgi:hypothetical protein